MPVLGIDVAKTRLDGVVLVDADGRKARSKSVLNTPAGFATLVAFACQQAAPAPPRPCTPCSMYRGAGATFLSEAGG